MSMTEFKEGWFTETWPAVSGKAVSFRVSETLENFSSEVQEISIFETDGIGKILALDGRICCAESDEFIYHEMLAHMTAFTHEYPSRALIIGGACGGTLRELLRHRLDSVDVCEPDESLVKACVKHFPHTAKSYSDSRVELYNEPPLRFLAGRPETYDIIIMDIVNPDGPYSELFSEKGLSSVRKALKADGVMSVVAGSYPLTTEFTEEKCSFFRKNFVYHGYARVQVPSMFCGYPVGFCIGSNTYDPKTPPRRPLASMASKFRYYSRCIHKASFVMPATCTSLLDEE